MHTRSLSKTLHYFFLLDSLYWTLCPDETFGGGTAIHTIHPRKNKRIKL